MGARKRRLGKPLLQRIAASIKPKDTTLPPFVVFKKGIPTRWERFCYSPIRYITRQAYEAFATFQAPTTPRSGSQAPIVRVVCISDTHSRHRRLPPLPSGDILIHAGDLTNSGKEFAIREALRWLSSAPHPYKVFVAGNHDNALAVRETRDAILADYPNLTYLEDSMATIRLHDRDITLYGTPRISQMVRRRDASVFRMEETSEPWMEKIPLYTDILVTHGPPQYHRDVAGFGCPHLLHHLWRVRPRLHVFGHIHGGRGVEHLSWRTTQASYEGVCKGRLGWTHALRVVYAALWRTLGNHTPYYRAHKDTLLVNASSLGKARDRRLQKPIVIELELPLRRRRKAPTSPAPPSGSENASVS